MLTDADKDRIRSEELYRSEVQKEVQKNSPGKKFWAALNSAFLLWFLSTLVVGSVTFFYSKWEKGKEEDQRHRDNEQSLKNERRSAIRKLDIEIASRLTALDNLIRFEKRSQKNVTQGKDLLVLDGAAVSGYSANAIPEFAGRNFQSLLYELSSRIKDDTDTKEEEKTEIGKAYEKSKDLTYRHLFEIFAAQHPINPVTKDISGFTRLLELETFDLQRWDKPLKFIAAMKEGK